MGNDGRFRVPRGACTFIDIKDYIQGWHIIMEEQVEKLQKATDDAESQMKKNKQLLDDSNK